MRCLLIVLAVCVSVSSPAAAEDSWLFELRIYTAAEGKLDQLHKRFRDHTCKLFEKHGMKNIGYWVPVENKENKLYYVIAHKNLEARNKSFENFLADPEWKKAFADSTKEGKLVTDIQATYLMTTDYSPAKIKPAESGKDRVFELRTYTASKGNLAALNSRFRDHTCKLFEKHGMTNVMYWNILKEQKDADKMLIYLLAHDSVDARKSSFANFGKDPAWQAARTASEKKAGGSLTEKGGVKFVLLKPTDYSPLK